jgi:hypothetical protein
LNVIDVHVHVHNTHICIQCNAAGQGAYDTPPGLTVNVKGIAMTSTADTADTTRTSCAQPPEKLRTTENLAARYWIEREAPAFSEAEEAGSDIATMQSLYQWCGDDLRDAEAKIEVALGEVINQTQAHLAVDVGIALLLASALFDLRRIRGAEMLAGEEVAHV